MFFWYLNLFIISERKVAMKVNHLPKKMLSVLLSVAMLAVSCSVGLVVFASDDSTTYTYEDLANVLMSDLIKEIGSYASQTTTTNGTSDLYTGSSTTGSSSNGYYYYLTTTITLDSYEDYTEVAAAVDCVQYIIEATDEYNRSSGSNSSSNRAHSNFSIIYDEIYDALISGGYMTESEFSDYNSATFLMYFLDMSNCSYYYSSSGSNNNSTSKANVYMRYFDVVTVTTSDYYGYLATVGTYDNVEESAINNVTYYTVMARESYSTGSFVKTYHYFNETNYSSYPFGRADSSDWGDVYNTVNEHADYLESILDTTFADLVVMYNDGELDSFISEVEETIEAAETYVNGSNVNYQTNYETLYADYMDALEDLYSAIDAAQELDTYITLANALAEFVEENADYGTYDYGAYDYETMLEDWEEYLVTYNAILAGSELLVSYLVDEGYIDDDYYTNFRDNVYVYDLAELAETVADLIDYYNESEDLTDEELTAIKSSLTGYLETIQTYSDQVITSIYPDADGTSYDLSAIEYVISEIDVELNEYVQYFASLCYTDLVALGGEAVMAYIDEYADEYAGLEAFYEELVAATDEDTAESLMGTLMTAAQELEDGLYDALYTLFAESVDIVYDALVAMGLENITEFTSVADYFQFKAVANTIEFDLDAAYSYLTAYEYEIEDDIEEEYQIILNVYVAMLTFAASYGFNYFETTEVDYGEREVYSNDQVKTETTYTSEEELNEVIDSLDAILTSDTFTELIGGTSLSDTVTGLLEDLIYTDDFINTIVALLYPLVADAFDDAWDGLNVEEEYAIYSGSYSEISYDIYLKFIDNGMYDITYLAGLYIYPGTLAQYLSDNYEEYSENVAVLFSGSTETSITSYSDTSAIKSWDDARLYDSDGNLNLSWGVDDAEDKETAFYTALTAALSGLEPLLNALLCGVDWTGETATIAEDYDLEVASSSLLGSIVSSLLGDVYVYLDLTATGNYGYLNLLAPIFEALGYDTSNLTTEYTLDGTDLESVLRAIIEPIFEIVEDILESPVASIIDILPNIVYAIQFEMISPLLSMLQTTIAYDAFYESTGSLISIGETVIADTVEIDVGTMLDLDSILDLSNGVSGLLEDLLGISLDLDEAALAQAGTLDTISTIRLDYIYDAEALGLEEGTAYTITANRADVGYLLLETVAGLLVDTDTLTSLLGSLISDEDTLSTIVSIIEGLDINEVDDVIIAISELFNTVMYEQDTIDYTATDDEDDDDDDSTDETVLYNVIYTTYWTEDMASYVADNLVDFLTDLLTLFGLYDLTDLIDDIISDLDISSYIYTTSNVDSILSLITDLLSSIDDYSSIIDIVDTLIDDISIADLLDTIANYEYEEFEDGDSEGFADALKGLIEPLVPILKLFLVSYEDDETSALTILDEITFYGYNGYENALVPILEALGCEGIVSYEEFITLSDSEMVDAVIDPIIAVIDDICTDTIDTALTLLPNVIEFIQDGYLDQAIEVLLEPIYVIFDVIRPIYDINFTINLDLTELLTDLLASVDLPFSIDIEELLNLLVSIAVEEEYTTEDGETALRLVIDLSAIDADEIDIDAAFLTYTLRSLIYYLLYDETYEEVGYILLESDFLDDEGLELWNTMWNNFVHLDTDTILFVFYYVFFGLNTGVQAVDEVVELVQGEIYDVLYKLGAIEGQDQLSDLIDNVNSFLNQILSDLGVDEDEDGVLSFFQKIIDFFYKIWKWIQSVFFVEW